MQIQEWESTVRGAVIMEQALVHGSQNPTWPQKERAAHIQRQSSTGRNDLSASLLYVWPWLVYWPQPFEWHPKPELCTPKFPFVPDEINSHPVALYQAEQVSCSKCERPPESLPSWSRRKVKASPDSLWAGEQWLSRGRNHQLVLSRPDFHFETRSPAVTEFMGMHRTHVFSTLEQEPHWVLVILFWYSHCFVEPKWKGLRRKAEAWTAKSRI